MKLKLVQSRDEINKNPAKLGQAIHDILSKPQYTQTVEETIEAMTPKYYQELQKAAESGTKEYNGKMFYVIVLRKKYTVNGRIDNVLHHKYCVCPHKPKAQMIREECPNADHDVYEVDPQSNMVTLLWTLPTKQDAKTILDTKQLYDPQLVKWIQDFNEGKLA